MNWIFILTDKKMPLKSGIGFFILLDFDQLSAPATTVTYILVSTVKETGIFDNTPSE